MNRTPIASPLLLAGRDG